MTSIWESLFAIVVGWLIGPESDPLWKLLRSLLTAWLGLTLVVLAYGCSVPVTVPNSTASPVATAGTASASPAASPVVVTSSGGSEPGLLQHLLSSSPSPYVQMSALSPIDLIAFMLVSSLSGGAAGGVTGSLAVRRYARRNGA